MSDLSTKASIERADPAQYRWGAPAAALVIVLAGVGAYHNSLHGPFLFDGVDAISENLTIRSLWPIRPVLSPPGGGRAVQDRPIINLSLAVNYAIGGLDVRGYHILNLAIHILAALVLFGIVRRTLSLPVMPKHLARASLSLALTTALIWTVHPLQTEAVTYVIQRAESLMGLFYLLTLYCMIRGATLSRPAWWYVAAVAACGLGVGCKEAMVTAPLVVLVYDRVFLTRSFKEVLRRRWLLYVALTATWGLLAAMVLPLSGRATLFGAQYSWALSNYALVQIAAIAHYLHLCFWPRPLIFDYGPLPFEGTTLGIWPATVMLIVGAATVWALCRRPWLGFLGVWFFAILAPSSTIVPLLIQPVAEKRMYLPLAAVVVIVVIGAYALGHRFWQRPGWPDRPHRIVGWIVGLTLVGAIALTLGIVTVKRNDDYSSAWSIWNDTVTKQPRNSRAWNNRGLTHRKKGNYDEAISDYTEAIRLNARNAGAHDNRGISYGHKGDLDKAIHDFTRAIELKGNEPDTYFNRGLTHGRKGHLDEAIHDFTRAIELEPNNAQFHDLRGLTHRKKGNYDAAIRDFTRVIEINPESTQAHNNRGLAHRKKGDFDKAFGDFNRAIELDQNYAEAHNNRGFAHAQNRDLDKAIRDFSRAIELDPDYVKAYYNRAATYGNMGNLDNAIRDYSRAIELDPNYAIAYSGRSMAYFGKRDDVRAWADVTKAQALGAKVDPRFIAALRESSPRLP